MSTSPGPAGPGGRASGAAGTWGSKAKAPQRQRPFCLRLERARGAHSLWGPLTPEATGQPHLCFDFLPDSGRGALPLLGRERQSTQGPQALASPASALRALPGAVAGRGLKSHQLHDQQGQAKPLRMFRAERVSEWPSCAGQHPSEIGSPRPSRSRSPSCCSGRPVSGFTPRCAVTGRELAARWPWRRRGSGVKGRAGDVSASASLCHPPPAIPGEVPKAQGGRRRLALADHHMRDGDKVRTQPPSRSWESGGGGQAPVAQESPRLGCRDRSRLWPLVEFGTLTAVTRAVGSVGDETLTPGENRVGTTWCL